jgi:hypothetical protein
MNRIQLLKIILISGIISSAGCALPGTAAFSRSAPTSSVESRVKAVREAILQRNRKEANKTAFNPKLQRDRKTDLQSDDVSQYYWPNWSNWPNWNNWRNWANWGNWGNY